MYKRKNRKLDECREMDAKVGVIKNAKGSAMFKIGSTVAMAAVYGPRALHPKHLQNPKKGRLRCNYNMMAFSGSGDRVRPGPSRRSKEISEIMHRALDPVIDLTGYPNTVVDVFVELIQTDAGTRCAGIVAASMALADAGFPMKDLISAVSAGKVQDTVVIDLDKYEEDLEASDMPVAMMPRTGEITLLQLDGFMTKEDIKEALKLAKKSSKDIYELQKKALKARYVK